MIISFKNNDGKYEEGYADGQNSIISTFSSTTVTVNGNYGSSANPLSSITVNIAQTGHTDEELEEAFDSGYNSGETHQKSLLVSTAITENGSYQRENGWSGVTVNVDTASTYNNGYTSGYTDGYESGSTDEKSKLSAITITANTAITVSEGGYSGITVNVPDNFAKLIDKSITEAVIPNGIETIGDNTFSECTSLSSVTIPNGVTSIGQNAFQKCRSLSSVEIPNGVTKINNGTFSGCTSLSSVTIPSGVTSIGQNAFQNCRSLSSVVIPISVTSIDQYAFAGCSSLSYLGISLGVTSIGVAAFSGCSSVTGVTLGIGVTSIAGSAFRDCTSIKRISAYPTTAPTIVSNSFLGVPSTGTVYYPKGSNYSSWKSNQNLSGWTFTAQ